MFDDRKECILCGKAYRYCEGCPTKYNVKETWRNIFCSEECREIYKIYDSLKGNKATDVEAGKILRKYDSSFIERTKEPMKAMLLVAYNDKPKTTKPIEKKETTKEVEELPQPSSASSSKKKSRKKKDIEVN